MPPKPEDAALLAEVSRRVRLRMKGVALCVAAALLFYVGVHYSLRMMHGPNLPMTPALGTIVAVEIDPQDGETLMTSEFTDAQGSVHRDTQASGYHYAPGEPVVGQRIEYLYGHRAIGGFYAFPRADRLLQWVFGVPSAFFVVLGAILAAVILRQRNLRRRLVREGRREIAQAALIRYRNVVLPGAGGNAVSLPMWRLEARYFEPTRFEFVECRSDWQATKAPPELQADTPLPPILVDPERPSRYWLPVGALAPDA